MSRAIFFSKKHVLFTKVISITIVDQTPEVADLMDNHEKIPIPIQNIVKPKDENEGLLKMSFSPTFLQTFLVKEVDMCKHMHFVAPDSIWVSGNQQNLMLTNTKGEILYHVKCNRSHGIHTVSSDRNLIYIDNDSNIQKLSEDLKFTKIVLEKENSQ